MHELQPAGSGFQLFVRYLRHQHLANQGGLPDSRLLAPRDSQRAQSTSTRATRKEKTREGQALGS